MTSKTRIANWEEGKRELATLYHYWVFAKRVQSATGSEQVQGPCTLGNYVLLVAVATCSALPGASNKLHMLPFKDGVHGVMGWSVSLSTGVAVSDLLRHEWSKLQTLLQNQWTVVH